MTSSLSCPSCGEGLALEAMLLRERRRWLYERAELLGRVLGLYVCREVTAANVGLKLRAAQYRDRVEEAYEAVLNELRVVLEMQEALAQ